MFEFTNSYDDKIMNWDRKNFNELVSSMTDEEIDEMADVIANGFGCGLEIDLYNDTNTEDYSIEVVDNYIKRWLYSQIEQGIQYGTKELFEIATCNF